MRNISSASAGWKSSRTTRLAPRRKKSDVGGRHIAREISRAFGQGYYRQKAMP
jgi:hypothetical protein